MGGGEDDFDVLEEGVVDGFDFYPEMIAYCMEEPASLEGRRVLVHFIFVIQLHVRVDDLAIELLAFLPVDEQHIQKVGEQVLDVLVQAFDGGVEDPFEHSGDHLDFEDLAVVGEAEQVGHLAQVSNVYPVLVHDVLDRGAVDDEEGRLVQHLHQRLHVFVLDRFASLGQLQFASLILLEADLAEHSIGKLVVPTQHDFWPEIPCAFDDVAVDEEGPQLAQIQKIILGLLQSVLVLVRGVQDRLGVNPMDDVLLGKHRNDFVELDCDTEGDLDNFVIGRKHSIGFEVEVLAYGFEDMLGFGPALI